MLDWTTSFLSDETIIKLRSKSVKHFLEGYNIHARKCMGHYLEIECEKNAPHSCGASTKTRRQLPKPAEKINPTCDSKKQSERQLQVVHNAAKGANEIRFMGEGARVVLQESVEPALQ